MVAAYGEQVRRHTLALGTPDAQDERDSDGTVETVIVHQPILHNVHLHKAIQTDCLCRQKCSCETVCPTKLKARDFRPLFGQGQL